MPAGTDRSLFHGRLRDQGPFLDLAQQLAADGGRVILQARRYLQEGAGSRED